MRLRNLFATFALSLALAGCGTMEGLNPFAGDTPPQTQPVQPKAYVIFFQGLGTTLSPDAKAIVAAAAREAGANPDAIVTVSGPSTAVAAGYDPRYAQPRIDAVISELLADGVRQGRIAQGASLTDSLRAGSGGAQRVEIRVSRP